MSEGTAVAINPHMLPKLFTALAKAVSEAEAVQKDKRVKNTAGTVDYEYASCEAIIDEARVHMAKNGISVIPFDFRVALETVEIKPMNAAPYTRFVPKVLAQFLFAHASGESMLMNREWVIRDDPQKFPLDKAAPAAGTICLAYLYRDLLMLPRRSKDELEAEERREQAMVAAGRAPAQGVGSAPSGSTTVVVPGAAPAQAAAKAAAQAEGEKIKDQLAAMVEEGAKKMQAAPTDPPKATSPAATASAPAAGPAQAAPAAAAPQATVTPPASAEALEALKKRQMGIVVRTKAAMVTAGIDPDKDKPKVGEFSKKFIDATGVKFFDEKGFYRQAMTAEAMDKIEAQITKIDGKETAKFTLVTASA